MYRVERHIIVKSKEMDRICFLSKNLYNYVNFILRQAHLKRLDEIKEYKHLKELPRNPRGLAPRMNWQNNFKNHSTNSK